MSQQRAALLQRAVPRRLRVDVEQLAECGLVVGQEKAARRRAVEYALIHGRGHLKARGIPPQESLANLLQAMRAAPTCMGHNIHQFDIPFMLAESRRLGMEPPDCTDFIDTAALFKGRKLGLSKRDDESFKVHANRVLSRRVAGLKFSIPACLKELRIKPGPGQLHDASQDAYLTHLIFQALRRVL